jgi:hypothetical protein
MTNTIVFPFLVLTDNLNKYLNDTVQLT